jgi:hypothetical protein
MRRFAEWSLSRSTVFPSDGPTSCTESSNGSNVVSSEISALTHDMLENVLTASATALRSTLEVARAQWEEQNMTFQQRLLSTQIGIAEDTIMQAVADVLSPILAEVELQQMMEEFAVTLKKVLPDFVRGGLTVQAPSHAKHAVERALHDNAVEAEVIAFEAAEVTAGSDRVQLSASLRHWSEKLKEVVSA